MWTLITQAAAFTTQPVIVRPVIKVPPPTVIMQHASANVWSEWVLPCIVAGAAVVAAVFAVLAFVKMHHQSKLQHKEIELALETRDITKDQASKADDERLRAANADIS